MLGLLLGIYMTLQGDLRRFEAQTHKYAANGVECVSEAKTEVSAPIMSETVKEYSHWMPKMPETVQEYMERGREWADYIESLTKVNVPDIYAGNMEWEEKQVGIEMSSPEGMTYYSTMELTAYMWTGNPCADGVYPAEGYTAACNDPALWHKWVYIEGVGTYYIHDTGGMASNVIDIYVKDIDVATQFGRQTANVYILED
jgi:3D (Asp-Asp-Asp) domain-containing protein